MFLRWKETHKRPAWAKPGVVIRSRNGGPAFTMGEDGFVLYSAQIVENHRAGKRTHQKVVLHLGSIPAHLLHDALARAAFWDQLADKLSEKVWLPPHQRQAILDQIAARVPRPTPTAQAQYARLLWHQHTPRWRWNDQLYRLRTGAGWRIARRQQHVAGPGIELSPRQHQVLEALASFQRREGRPLTTAEWRNEATRSGVPTGTFYKARQVLIRKEFVQQV